jgi:hypothetical protein
MGLHRKYHRYARARPDWFSNKACVPGARNSDVFVGAGFKSPYITGTELWKVPDQRCNTTRRHV